MMRNDINVAFLLVALFCGWCRFGDGYITQLSKAIWRLERWNELTQHIDSSKSGFPSGTVYLSLGCFGSQLKDLSP